MNFEEKLKKYAELLVKVGLNIQKNDYLVIRAPLEAKDLVELCIWEAYKQEAKDVHVIWTSATESKARLQFAHEEILEEVPKYKVDEMKYYLEKGAAFLTLTGSDPELYNTINPTRLQKYTQNLSTALEEFSDALMKDKNPWTVAAFAHPDWAQKVFPKLDKESAQKRLWDCIFYSCRVDENTIENWKKHIRDLSFKCEQLNNLRLEKLFFSSENGTNLEIKLPTDHIWCGGKSISSQGREFVANIPTEEIYTLPEKFSAKGKVQSTMPFNYSGNLVENFHFYFEEGKAVDFWAQSGNKILENLLKLDQGSSYLGEVALVPYNSPISNLNILFYNTLFDENASCHLALGKAYPTCLKNGDSLSNEELEHLQANDSISHEDFMIGAKDLKIQGQNSQGDIIKIFEDGNWAL